MEKSVNRISKHPYLKIFIECTLLFFVCTAPFLILSKGVYLSYGDFNAQEIPFWIHIYNTLRDGMPAYDWNSDLGMNFWGSYTYFGLTDPFTLMGLLFPPKLLPYGITLIQALKFGFCGLTSYIYIRPWVKKETSAYIGAILYTFSGQQLFSMCFIFSEVFALFPLLLYSFDKLVKERRSVCFALLLALMGFTNYYFLFSSCVFILIYFIVKVRCKEYIIDKKLFAKIAAETMMGILICTVSLLPAFYVLKNNERAGSTIFENSLLYYDNPGTIIKIFSSAFLQPDLCSTKGIIGERPLLVGSVSLFLPLYLIVGAAAVLKKNKKAWYSRLLTVCAVMACIPLFNSMFYAFNSTYYARWFYMPLLLMCALTGRYVDEFETTEIRSEIRSSAIFIAAFTILGLPEMIRNNTTMVITCVTYSAVCLLILFYFRYKYQKYSDKALKRLTVAFAVIPFIMQQVNILNITYMEHINNSMVTLYNNMQEVHIDDDVFFRLSSDNNDLVNNTLLWELPSIDTYHNLTTRNESDFYDMISSEGFLNHDENASDFALHSFLSVKYDIYNNKPNPGGIEVEPENIIMRRYGFKQHDVQGYQVIYENENFIPMGFTYDYYLNINRIKKNDTKYYDKNDDLKDAEISHDENERREKLLLKGIWLDDEQCMKYMDRLTVLPTDMEDDISNETYVQDCNNRRSSAAYEFTPDKNGFTSKIKVDKPNLVFYSVPYDDGWTAYVDGVKTDIEKVFAGLCAVPVDAGDHTIRFDYKVTWLKEGFIVTCAAGAAFVIYAAACLILSRRKKASADE